ncbi:MAG: hypothetical protein ACI4L9_06550, partial [Candidatus Coproplasma sp.]
MKKNKKKTSKFYIVYIIAILIVGALLAVALWFNLNSPDGITLPLIKSETIYVIIALAILLPLLLIIFLITALVRRKKSAEESETVILEGVLQVSGQPQSGKPVQTINQASLSQASPDRTA